MGGWVGDGVAWRSVGGHRYPSSLRHALPLLSSLSLLSLSSPLLLFPLRLFASSSLLLFFSSAPLLSFRGIVGAEQLHHAARTIRGTGHVLFTTHSQTFYEQDQVAALGEFSGASADSFSFWFSFSRLFFLSLLCLFSPPPSSSTSSHHTTPHHTTHHHQPFHPISVATPVSVACCETPAADMMNVDGATGAARRRRERSLRSAWRHEQLSVAVALAAATHHSAQQYGAPRSQKTTTRATEVEEHEKNEAPRRLEPPPPGERPGLPLEHGPQRVIALCDTPQEPPSDSRPALFGRVGR